MRKIVRLTEEEFKSIMHNSVQRALQEHYVDMDKEIRLAQQALMKIGKYLPDVGLRLSDTQFESLYRKAKESIIELNNALIKHIKGEK